MKNTKKEDVIKLVDSVLAQRTTINTEHFNGFKSKKGSGTMSICECSDDGGDGCSE